MIYTQKDNAELMFRVCSQVLLSSSVTSVLYPPNWCNSHGRFGSTWVTSRPKGDDPCSTERGKKSLSGFSNLVPVWPCTFWQLAEVIRVDLPYSCIIKIGKSLWREPMNCTYWAASDCWVVPLVSTVHTMFWLVSISWSKKRCKAKRSKCNREKVLPLAMKSHSKQIIWDQKGHIVE